MAIAREFEDHLYTSTSISPDYVPIPVTTSNDYIRSQTLATGLCDRSVPRGFKLYGCPVLFVDSGVPPQSIPLDLPCAQFPPCFLRRSQKHRCEGRAWLYGRLRLVLA